MKRDTNIVPLSHDHHHGLAFCRNIRRGLDKQVSPDRIRPYVLDFYGHQLDKHFREEEDLLFAGLTDPLTLRALDEHRLIRELVQSIEGAGGGTAENYRTLADLLDRHIRFEERELFLLLEKSLSNEQLSKVGAALARTHTDPPPCPYSLQ